MTQWQRFTDGFEVNEQSVPLAVLQSWERSRGAGVESCNGRLPGVSAVELESRLERHARLVTIARAFLHQASAALRHLPHLVLLTDHEGVVLECEGHHPSMHDLGLVAGCHCGESQLGTNGLALALASDAPAQVSGPEHYRHELHGWSCAAAPLHQAGGQTAGAIAICADFKDATPERLLLVEHLALSIDRALAHGTAPEIHRGDAQLFDERLLSMLPTAVYVCDAAGGIRYFNERAAELWGRKPVGGQGGEQFCACHRAYAPNGDPILPEQSPMAVVLQTGEPRRNQEAVIERPDGSRITVIVNIDAIRNTAGEIIGAVNAFQDISDRKAAETSNAMLAAIVESSEVAIVGKSLDGTITSWNPGAERLYGYAAREAVGRSVAMLIPPDRADEFPQILQRLAAGQQVEPYETVRLRKQGDTVEVSVLMSPIRDAQGNIGGASAISRDITERKRAERARRTNEERLRLALEAGQMGTWDWDIERNHVAWSPGLHAIHGLEPGAFPGTFEAYQSDIHPDDREEVIRSISETVQSGREHRLEYRLVWPDGSLHWVEARGKLFTDAAGKPSHMIGVCMEVTQRKRMERDLRMLAEASRSTISLGDADSTLQAIARQAVPDFADWCIIHTADSEGQLQPLPVFHNRPEKASHMEELCQRYPSLLKEECRIGEVFATGEPYLLEDVAEAMPGGRSSAPEHAAVLKKLSLRSILCVPLSLRDRNLGVMTFLTSEAGRRYRPSDRAVAQDLAHRAAVAAENTRLYAELQQEGQRKDEFLAMLAHELRNPLAPIRSGLDVLRLRGRDNDMIELMQEQVAHLARMVDDLLDVSRIMRGKIQLRRQSVELAAIVQQAVETVRSYIEGNEQHLRLSLAAAPVYLQADPMRLTQAITNLLHNASKYTDRQGTITLTAGQQGHEAVVSVRDTGIGIGQEWLPHVFKLFAQADQSLERSQGGLGIGLTLAQNLVNMHGGSVHASSPGKNQGSTFEIRLPCSRVRLPNLAESPVLEQTKRWRILVVDDNAAAAKMLARLLATLGAHDVRTASEGKLALSCLDEFQPQIVLLDIGLPGMDGYQIAREIRSIPECEQLLLAAVTGYGQEDDRRRSKEAGFDEHLVKPVAVAEILKLLRHPKLRLAQ